MSADLNNDDDSCSTETSLLLKWDWRNDKSFETDLQQVRLQNRQCLIQKNTVAQEKARVVRSKNLPNNTRAHVKTPSVQLEGNKTNHDKQETYDIGDKNLNETKHEKQETPIITNKRFTRMTTGMMTRSMTRCNTVGYGKLCFDVEYPQQGKN